MCREWGYRWGYTIAQIELMVADQPLIVYDRGCAAGSAAEKEHTKEEMDALADRWLERKKRLHGENWSAVGRKTEMHVGSRASRKVSLDSWLGGKD